jgi:hypothetical protein
MSQTTRKPISIIVWYFFFTEPSHDQMRHNKVETLAVVYVGVTNSIGVQHIGRLIFDAYLLYFVRVVGDGAVLILPYAFSFELQYLQAENNYEGNCGPVGATASSSSNSIASLL